MNETGTIEKRLNALERDHSKTRDYLVGLTSCMVAALGAALFEQYGKPASNLYTQIIVFAIGFVVVRRITRWTLKV